MPEQSKRFHDILLDFAKKMGKHDPEEYVNSGGWKARQGGAKTLAVEGRELCALLYKETKRLKRILSKEKYSNVYGTCKCKYCPANPSMLSEVRD